MFATNPLGSPRASVRVKPRFRVRGVQTAAIRPAPAGAVSRKGHLRHRGHETCQHPEAEALGLRQIRPSVGG